MVFVLKEVRIPRERVEEAQSDKCQSKEQARQELRNARVGRAGA